MQMADKGEKYEIELPISNALADVAGAPADVIARIVQRIGKPIDQSPMPSTSTGESDWVLAGVSDLVQNLASELADVAAGQGWLFARDLEYFELAETAKAFVLRHYEPAVQAQGVADGNLISELVGALTLLLAARKDVELMTAAIVAEAAIAKTEGRS